jgi:AbrB family looped-hinge helix DNA binding protein
VNTSKTKKYSKTLLTFGLPFVTISPVKIVYATLSTKGQIVIPAELRDELKLSGGTKLAIQREGRALVLRPITPEFIDSLCGSTQGLGKLREQAHRDDEER